MSDEHDEPTWFPRELRDVRTAFAVEMLIASLMSTAIGTTAAAGVAYGAGTKLPPWIGPAMMVGLYICLPATFAVMRVTTRYRCMGLTIPYSTALFVWCGLLAVGTAQTAVYSFTISCLCVPLALAAGQFTRPLRLRPLPLQKVIDQYWWVRTWFAFGNLFPAAFAIALAYSVQSPELMSVLLKWWVVLFAALLCVWCWLRLFRPFFELGCEVVFWVMYSIRTAGPGLKAVPPFGPVLVIANHAAWFDPCFLGKILPRPITAMMTEGFYKIWFLRPILKYVFRVIVVPEKSVRHDAPELRQAIEALGRGECVVLFPEGYLRRKEEVPLRRFGQGVWHILRACPDTPVICCWIEGSWGSKFSWRGGPPTKNKKMDFRRKIEIGVSAPEVVPADLLADGMRTRVHLMNRVSAARAHIGLPELPPFDLPKICQGDKEPLPTDSPT